MNSPIKDLIGRMKPGAPLVVAHRGDNANAPENTLASINLAWSFENIDAVEIDIHLSSDEKLIVIHDSTTGRTADRDIIVVDSTAEQIRMLDAGGWFSSKFAGEKIPLFSEVLDTIPEGKFLCVELKEGTHLAHAFCQEVEKLEYTDKVCALAFNPVYVKTIKTIQPNIPAMLLLAP